MNEDLAFALTSLRQILAEVQETQATRRTNPLTDFRCRRWFAKHGPVVAEFLERN